MYTLSRRYRFPSRTIPALSLVPLDLARAGARTFVLTAMLLVRTHSSRFPSPRRLEKLRPSVKPRPALDLLGAHAPLDLVALARRHEPPQVLHVALAQVGVGAVVVQPDSLRPVRVVREGEAPALGEDELCAREREGAPSAGGPCGSSCSERAEESSH